MPGWMFRWHRRWNDVWEEGFLSEWEEQFRLSPLANAYQHPGLVRCWFEKIAAPRGIEPAFGWAEHERGDRMLLPWAIAPHRGRLVTRRMLEFAGQHLSPYQDPLVVSNGSAGIDWSSFWRAVSAESSLSYDRALFPYLRREVAAATADAIQEASPILDLRGFADLDALLAACSANHRGDVRRRLRRINEKGEVRLWIGSRDEQGKVIRNFRERFQPSHDRICRKGGYSNPLESEEAASYVECFLTRGLSEGWAFYAALFLDDRSIAWLIGLLHRNELYWWRPTYDLDWESLSPGKVFLTLLLEESLRRGIERVHFHVGEQSYKLAWGPELTPLASRTWYASGLRGRAVRAYDLWRSPRRQGRGSGAAELS